MYANLDDMGKFLEIHTLPKLIQGGKENMNRCITTSDWNSSHKNCPGSCDFTDEFYWTVRRIKILQKPVEGHFPTYSKSPVVP